MALNLIEMAKSLLTSDVVRSIASHLGEDPEQIEKAAGAGIPALLAGLLQTISSSEGASRLGDLLKHDPPELTEVGGLESVLGNLASALSGPTAQKLISYGQILLTAVFGSRLTPVLDEICKASGIKPGSAASLLATLAPLVIGLLKKEAHTEDFSAPGLVELLLSQKELLAKFIPPGLLSALGIKNLAELGPMADSLKSAVGALPRTQGASWLPLAAAAALLALAAGGYFYFFGGRAGPTQEIGAAANPAVIARDLPRSAARAIAKSVADADKDAKPLTKDGKPLVETASKLVTLSLPGDAKLEVPGDSCISAVVAFLSDGAKSEPKSFIADGMAFDGPTAKLTADSTASIDKLATVLKAYGSAKVTIEVHTDNAGDAAATKKSAQDQATALKDALVKAGVPAERITAVGVGPDRPIASNDSEDGRAKNRRIELLIVAK